MRLIDADALIEMAKTRGFMGNTFGEVVKLYADEMPTIEERKTGKWAMDGFCTVCGEEAITEWNDCGGELAFTKYCPNCGARMEE